MPSSPPSSPPQQPDSPSAERKSAALKPRCRPEARGKFLFVNGKKLMVNGVTYGTFKTLESGVDYPEPEQVKADFDQMKANGVNAVRTYTPPPLWLLDLALESDLYLMIGLPWEQHVTFLEDTERTRRIEKDIREKVRQCEKHPAILCYSIGNEIPTEIARWHGRREIEQFLHRLYKAVKEEDPEGLVTYVNYPPTEYLKLPFLDLFCFNVYLEQQEKLEAYLARLHHLCGDRPLILAEIGLDSQRNGLDAQANTLSWQISTCLNNGCAGLFVFSWTDEWHRGGNDILDWDFGITTRDRQPKSALDAVRNAFQPKIEETENSLSFSVVVCTYNGSRTLDNCLRQLCSMEYPDYEVIVVNDGSTDSSAKIASRYPCKLITTKNEGLSNARNTGLQASNGDVVAYIDDDAYPDPDWLHFLSLTFEKSEFAAVGGPNIAPKGDGPLAECVLNAPGGPIHVMLSDREAEHIPGCNMAFRKECLQSIGGFDPQFRVAGDDVDVCWRIQQQGWKIGFSPAAVVWHHRRNSIRTYWKQQQGYGKAEALLEKKWPDKYNALGHARWAGQLYGPGLVSRLINKSRVYHGAHGKALFQSLHEPSPSLLTILPTIPEWYLILLAMAALGSLGFFWSKLFLIIPILVLAIGVSIVQAILSTREATFPSKPRTASARIKRNLVTFLLHLTQPMARLYGRIRHGLTAWRLHAPRGSAIPFLRVVKLWSQEWHSPEEQLNRVTKNLKDNGAIVMQGGEFDRWDLEVRGDLTGSARALMTVEEHGNGNQYFKFRIWPQYHTMGTTIVGILVLLAACALFDDAIAASRILAATAAVLFFRTLQATSYAVAAIETAIGNSESKQSEQQAE